MSDALIPPRREPWYLFCGDQGFAETCLLEAFGRSRNAAEQVWLLKLLSRLGGWAALEQLLVQHQHLLELAGARAALLQLRQHQEHANPWLCLLPEADQGPFLAHWQPWLRSEATLQVVLSGGLGDQLEALALLTNPPWNQRLEVILPPSSTTALQSLLEQASQTAPLPRWRFGHARADQPWLSWMALQAILSSADVELVPQILLPAQLAGKPELIVVCWRSKSEAGERLWGHLRSLPMAEITRIYSWLLPWAAERGWRIADITHYSGTEQRQLLLPGLALMAAELRSLADTADQLRRAALVITVDTALVHLAHALDRPRWLLLHRHPDQRWQRRLQQDGGSDQRSLRVLQQTHPQQWHAPLQRLQAELGA